jgi:hypothetical protein
MSSTNTIDNNDPISKRLDEISQKWREEVHENGYVGYRFKLDTPQEILDEHSKLLSAYWTPERMASAKPF